VRVLVPQRCGGPAGALLKASTRASSARAAVRADQRRAGGAQRRYRPPRRLGLRHANSTSARARTRGVLRSVAALRRENRKKRLAHEARPLSCRQTCAAAPPLQGRQAGRAPRVVLRQPRRDSYDVGARRIARLSDDHAFTPGWTTYPQAASNYRAFDVT